MKTDFPELEGPDHLIDFIRLDGTKIKGLVVGCNIDVGVSIVNADDKDVYLYCFIGDSAPSSPGPASAIIIKQVYDIVDAIKNGVIDERVHRKSGREHGVGASSETCVFAQ